MKRRGFLGTGAAALLQSQPGETIRVAVVGPGGRGTQLLRECIEHGSKYNARVTGVCDIWNQRRDAAAKIVRESYGTEPKVFPKLDHVLADSGIDAVIIATPDHQHAKMLAAAVQAGKHVYCEKPMGNVLSELNAAMAAIERSDRIVQLGTQRRSYPKYRAASRLIREGRIGDIAKIDVIWNEYSPYRWARKPEELQALKETDVDWNEFLYGKPGRPFDPKLYRSFRLFREFSSGIVDQWMTHGIDVVHMLSSELYPMTVVADGGTYFWKDYRENPDTMEAVLKYGHGGRSFLATYATCLASAAGKATRVIGTLGTVEVENVWRISGEGSGLPNRIQTPGEIPDEPGTMHHMANWLDCVRRRDRAALYCPPIAGYGHSVACIMTVQALWTGRRHSFDPTRREITSV
jgi:predicted dehydrogenase